jgi:HlyD family secretion protein
MKRKTLIAAGIAAAVVLALGGGYAYSAASNRPLVGVATVGTAPLSVTVSASGKLVPAHTSGVYPPAVGTLASVLVHDGDTVKADQILARVDTGPLRLALAQARAAYAAALAQSETVNNAVPSDSERSAANYALSAARSQADTAAKNYADYLADYNAASPADKDTMRPTLRTLKSARSTANAAVKTAQAGINRLTRAGQVSKARAAANQSITAAAEALARAQRNLAHADLTAPFDGTVTFNGTVEAGAGVTTGVAVFTVVDPKRMEFEAAVNETDIAGVLTGQAAVITLDAFTDPFTGKVTQVQASPQLTSTGGVAFGVRVAFTTGSARLFQGMSGSADIEVQSIPNAVVVPIESVMTKGTTKSVFVLDAADVVRSRTVTIGASTDTAAQVLSGVSVGERVVTTGASALSDGQQVRTK